MERCIIYLSFVISSSCLDALEWNITICQVLCLYLQFCFQLLIQLCFICVKQSAKSECTCRSLPTKQFSSCVLQCWFYLFLIQDQEIFVASHMLVLFMFVMPFSPHVNVEEDLFHLYCFFIALIIFQNPQYRSNQPHQIKILIIFHS